MHPNVIHIRRVLKDRGISYARLSEMADVDESKLKRVLSGRQSMTLEMNDQLMLALSIKDVKNSGTNVSPSEFITMWNKLPAHTKLAIINLINAILGDFRS